MARWRGSAVARSLVCRSGEPSWPAGPQLRGHSFAVRASPRGRGPSERSERDPRMARVRSGAVAQVRGSTRVVGLFSASLRSAGCWVVGSQADRAAWRPHPVRVGHRLAGHRANRGPIANCASGASIGLRAKDGPIACRQSRERSEHHRFVGRRGSLGCFPSPSSRINSEIGCHKAGSLMATELPGPSIAWVSHPGSLLKLLPVGGWMQLDQSRVH